MIRSHPESDERQYEQHRSAVLALLRARFGSALTEVDREDLYHEAWAGVIEHRARGRPTPDLLGLLKTIAWRRGRDRLRNRSAEPCDPSEGALAAMLDRRPATEEQVLQRIDAGLYRELIDSLGDRQRAILKLRCEMELAPAEIQEVLGISRKAYEKQLTLAFKHLAAELREVEDGRWRERQRELLAACEAGTATPQERSRAKRLLERDPAFRAMLRRMRGGAALLPLPALVIGRIRSALASAARTAASSSPIRAIAGIGVVKLTGLCATAVTLAGGLAVGVTGHRAADHPRADHSWPRVAAPAHLDAATSSGSHAYKTALSRARPRTAQAPRSRRLRQVRAIAAGGVAPGATAAGGVPRAAPPSVVRPRALAVRPTPPSPRRSFSLPPRHRTRAGDGSQEFGP